MQWEPKKLRTNHHEILRLSFIGKSNKDISEIVGISPVAISCILRSPLARAELERMRLKAEESITNIPLRTRLQDELNSGAEEALRLERAIIRDKNAELKVRQKSAHHLVDRVLFNKDVDTGESTESYRDILRKLDAIERKSNSVTVVQQTVIQTNNDSDSHPETIEEDTETLEVVKMASRIVTNNNA